MEYDFTHTFLEQWMQHVEHGRDDIASAECTSGSELVHTTEAWAQRISNFLAVFAQIASTDYTHKLVS